MPVLSAIIFDALLRASDPKMPAAPSAVHNCLVGGSSPPSPTTQSHANRDFSWFDEYPRLCGAQSRLAVSAGKKDRFRGSSGPTASGNPKTVSPERGRSGQRLGSHATETEQARRSAG